MLLIQFVVSSFPFGICAQCKGRFICQHLGGCGKCFEVYYRSFGAESEGFHFYCLEAGGGIIAPHCTGGSRGWRLDAAEKGAYRLLARCEILPRMLFFSFSFSACARSFITKRDGMSQPPTGGRGGKPASPLLFSWLFSYQKRKIPQPPTPHLIYLHLEAWDS